MSGLVIPVTKFSNNARLRQRFSRHKHIRKTHHNNILSRLCFHFHALVDAAVTDAANKTGRHDQHVKYTMILHILIIAASALPINTPVPILDTTYVFHGSRSHIQLSLPASHSQRVCLQRCSQYSEYARLHVS